MPAVADKFDLATARAWSRNPSDERAIAAGCRFDVERGAFVVGWIESYCKLYEGEAAGQPLILRGCLDCAYDLEGIDPLERAQRHLACVAAGHRVDWQYESTMQIFGWVRWSEKFNRWVRRFRQTSVWVAKKNKKSPTLAAWCLYLLCGDGEPGQKVFLAAKDGTQAREIAGKHVVEMLLQSTELQEECTLNRSLLQITHEASRSILRPLSSSNSRTQESKEGLNGSVGIDEVHVVDREFIARISRMGISRSEPLQIEVSTAGNNPDGYGQERFNYAGEVLSGSRDDQELFAAIYAAPQDLADADLDADPLKYARMANPALGHTVDPEEFLTDYRRSRGNLRTLADFKMYRLNIWQRSANPWIRAGDWAQCRRDFTAADMEGRACWAALDLSKTQDMSALVLCFPMDEEEAFRLLPFFWLPEDVARENDHLVPYLTWARDGHLFLTPGNVVDYGYIRSTFRELAQRFSIRELAYDQTYAEETTQAIEQGVMDSKGQVIEEGTWIPRFIFRQRLMEFALPSAEFERLIISGKLHHNGHPILTWQAGHVQVRPDANRNIRPVKPPREDHRKIDGIVSAVMVLGRTLAEYKKAGCTVEVW